MAPNNVLSYSQIRLYNECGQKYKYHYIDRLRPENKSSALFFGTALDKALEAVLNDPKIDERKVFDEWWDQQTYNKIQIKLASSFYIVYSATEFDSDILALEDVRFLQVKAYEFVPKLMQDYSRNILKVYTHCAAHRRDSNWDDGEHLFFNLANWLCMRRKGHLMLKANREFVLPRFKKIINAQPKIELNNGSGDILVGAADLVAIWEDGRTIVFDYKSSSIKYEQDAVKTSDQLTIYGHALEISVGGYIVFQKRILKNKTKICSKCGFNGSDRAHKTCPNTTEGKRCGANWNETICPSVDIQIIIDEIPTATEDLILDKIESSNDGIKNQVFSRNYDACRGPYGPCAYFNLCHGAKTKAGLVTIDER